MQCPYCKEDDDRVVNSRPSADGTYVKRRRECNRCGRRYTTYERIEQSVLRVIKKDGGREDFSRKKLLDGLMKACYKRPIPAERLEQLVDEVERQSHRRFEGEVPSRQLGEMVMERLRALDQVAYIRFASVYRAFTDVTDFVEEADLMMRQQGHGTKSAGEHS